MSSMNMSIRCRELAEAVDFMLCVDVLMSYPYIHEKRKDVFINGKERSKNRFMGCFSVG